jgi:hypothetical protein
MANPQPSLASLVPAGLLMQTRAAVGQSVDDKEIREELKNSGFTLVDVAPEQQKELDAMAHELRDNAKNISGVERLPDERKVYVYDDFDINAKNKPLADGKTLERARFLFQVACSRNFQKMNNMRRWHMNRRMNWKIEIRNLRTPLFL